MTNFNRYFSDDGNSFEIILTNDFIGLATQHQTTAREDFLYNTHRKIILNYEARYFSYGNKNLILQLLKEKIKKKLESKGSSTVYDYRQFCNSGFTFNFLADFFLDEVYSFIKQQETKVMLSFLRNLNEIRGKYFNSKETESREVINLFIINFFETNLEDFPDFKERFIAVRNNKEQLYDLFLKLISTEMQKNIVIALSGPDIILAAQVLTDEITEDPDEMQNLEMNYAIYKNPFLEDFSNKTPFVYTDWKKEGLKKWRTDVSWISLNRAEMDCSEDKMLKSAILLQRGYRAYREKHIMQKHDEPKSNAGNTHVGKSESTGAHKRKKRR